LHILITNEISSLEIGKSGNPWERLIALCSLASPDITAKIDVPVPGSFEVKEPSKIVMIKSLI